MYKIIGADGQPYGPVSAEQMRRWIAENRVNAQTQIQAEGGTGWKPISTFPEFTEALAAKATQPGSPPPTIGSLAPPLIGGAGPKVDADKLAAEILARDYNLDIGSCFSRSWNLVLQHFWLMVGATFVISLIQSVIGLLAGVLMGGLFFLIFKLIRRERAEFGDCFAGFNLAFLQLFLVGLIVNLLVAVGILLCILPGIYLAVVWVFAIPLVIDKKMEFWPAMELSRKVVSRHWWVIFGMMLVGMLVGFAGLLVCFVGVYVAQPVILGAFAFAYEDIFGRQPDQPGKA
jgi:hypothetical protein